MSWLARSITHTLLLDDEPDSINRSPDLKVATGITRNHEDEARGVKEDFSELTETLTRQFWGVASFLAPPPPPPPPRLIRSFPENGDAEVEDSRSYSDNSVARDLGEEDSRSHSHHFNVGGGEEEDFRSNSDGSDVGDREEENNSDYCNVGDQEEAEDAIGVTEEALAFAHNIGHHPETWLDFPLEEEEEEGFEDFHISDSQYKHALAIQRLVPTLAALKIELCPVHMSEGYFWMVYFVLLHSRLNKNDADQLSSSELVQARSMWREELQKRAKLHTDWFDRSTFHLQDSTLSPTISAREECDPEFLEDSDTRHLSFNKYNSGSRLCHEPTYNETEKQIVESDKTISAETPSGHSEGDLLTFQSSQVLQDHDDEDDWLQETEELDGYSTTGIMVNEEDVSFSDLEEDSDWTLPVRSK